MADTNKPTKQLGPTQEAMSPDTSPARLAALAKLPDEAVQRAVAKNPRTPPKVLKKLGSSRDKYTRKAVAGNPNTPADIMSGLGGQFPMVLLGNPALDLLLLEDPDLFSEMPIGTLRSLAKRENCPEGLLVYMARSHQDRNLQRSLVQNPNTPRKVIEQIVESRTLEEIKEEARLHVTLSSELDTEHAETLFWESIANQVNCSTLLHWQLLSDAKVPEWVHASLVARQVLWGANGSDVRAIQENSVPIPVLESLAANGRIKVCKAACNNTAAPEWLREAKFNHQVLEVIQAHAGESLARLSEMYENCPSEYVFVLARHPLATDELRSRGRLPEWGDHKMQRRAAAFPFAWPELLEKLADDSEKSIREAVAGNPNTPAVVLEKLAVDTEVWVRRPVARNPNTPAAALEKLAGDEDYSVKQSVASNSNTHPETLENLAEEKWSRHEVSWNVRYYVASNSNTPASVLERLADDKSEEVKSEVASNPNTPASALERLADDKSESVKNKVASNPNTPASALERLAQDKNKSLRERVAINPNTPAAVLEKLAVDTVNLVRYLVAENPNTPAAVLEKLAVDTEVWVRYHAARNPNSPAAALEALEKIAVANKVTDHAIAKNPDTLVVILESLAVDNDSKTRCYVADNPSTPASVLEKLAKDGHDVVRWDVASNPNTPTLTLEILANDAVTRVRKTALDTLRRRQSNSVKN